MKTAKSEVQSVLEHLGMAGLLYLIWAMKSDCRCNAKGLLQVRPVEILINVSFFHQILPVQAAYDNGSYDSQEPYEDPNGQQADLDPACLVVGQYLGTPLKRRIHRLEFYFGRLKQSNKVNSSCLAILNPRVVQGSSRLRQRPFLYLFDRLCGVLSFALTITCSNLLFPNFSTKETFSAN